MDIVEAINTRRSIRAFKPDPVPRQVLEEILTQAVRAPSWSNTQPWEFIVVGKQKVEDIKRALDPIISRKELSRINPDFVMPQKYPDLYTVRKQTIGKTVFQVRGIERGDRGGRVRWSIQELQCFDVPNIIYICTDRSYYYQELGANVWPVFDCGLMAENIMLLATKYGLGTLASVAAVMCPDILREVLEIPDSTLILIAILIGYPDYDDPINQIRSERDPLEKISRWYGFD